MIEAKIVRIGADEKNNRVFLDLNAKDGEKFTLMASAQACPDNIEVGNTVLTDGLIRANTQRPNRERDLYFLNARYSVRAGKVTRLGSLKVIKTEANETPKNALTNEDIEMVAEAEVTASANTEEFDEDLELKEIEDMQKNADIEADKRSGY